MGAAFDAAWQSLIVRSSELTSAGLREGTREQLALRIIETAQTGERDVNRLRDDAVDYVLTVSAVSEARSRDAAGSRKDSLSSMDGKPTAAPNESTRPSNDRSMLP